MKTDQYLTLCLEQAANSPLHYRHGCIVVRGGKVIGQGYNDHRPGFDGGALKHGRVAKGTLDGPAMAELKAKLKKQKDKQQSQQPETKKPFIPFEGSNGGGHHANTTLSMHSEMMAIHSALSASPTLASTTTSCEKPCFKLPRGDKRKARLRRDVLSAYVKAVSHARAGCRFKSAVLKLPHLNQVLQEYNLNHNGKAEEDAEEDEEREKKEKGRAFHEVVRGEKHHQKNVKKKNGNREEYGYRYQYDRYGRQIQQPQHRRSASKRHSDNVIRGYDVTGGHDVNDTTTPLAAAPQHSKHEKDYKRSGKMKTRAVAEPPQPVPLLLPIGHANKATISVAERKKNARLNGADLYVVRLGRCGDATTQPKRTGPAPPAATANELVRIDSSSTSSDETFLSQSASSLPSTGSLHDELINPTPSSSPPPSRQLDLALNNSTVRASRPCYRCISYMHSVGIKRVFWTNDAGEWEGGKVRDLVDALDNSMEAVANEEGDKDKGGPTGNGVFVTKHEVLMLRRLVGPVGA